jgi:hypothetical protein
MDAFRGHTGIKPGVRRWIGRERRLAIDCSELQLNAGRIAVDN